LRLNVMTFNLRYSNQGDGENAWPHRKELAAELIRDVGPDVVGVQEALFSMLCELDEMLPEYEWIGEGREGGLKSEFSAVLYRKQRLQPITADRFWLSHRPDVPASRVPGTGLARMCTHVRFRERGTEREFLFYNTHLDHANQVAREIGADLILDHIDAAWQRYPLPTLLVGDMNADPSNPAIQAFQAERQGKRLLFDAYDVVRAEGGEVGATFHGFKGRTEGEPIDYIFHSSHWRVRELHVDRRADGARYPSDHYPVWGVFESDV